MTDTIAATLSWFQKAVPAPLPANITSQLGVHVEEFAEMLVELSPQDPDTNNYLLDALVAVQKLSTHLKQHPGCVVVTDEQRLKFLDSLCDQIVTAAGCAHMNAMDIVGAMLEVNRSNFSKFDNAGNPIFNENHKIMKGPLYSPADLTPYI